MQPESKSGRAREGFPLAPVRALARFPYPKLALIEFDGVVALEVLVADDQDDVLFVAELFKAASNSAMFLTGFLVAPVDRYARDEEAGRGGLPWRQESWASLWR